MFRTFKPPSTKKVSRKKHLPDEQLITHLPAPTHPTLQLQALIGNHATRRMIQRMPTKQAIINTLGKPKKNFGLIKNSTKYRLVLDCVHDYDHYVMQTTLGSTINAIKTQMQAVMTFLNAVMAAVNTYDGDTGRKAAYMQNLKPQIKNDMSAVSKLTLKYMSNPIPKEPPKLFIALSSANPNPLQLNENKIVGNDHGGSGEVTHFSQNEHDGYFKKNKKTLTTWSTDEEGNEIKDKAIEGKNKEESFFIRNMLNNEMNMSTKIGIDSMDSHMTNRDIAMHRLDQMLEGGVIAKTEIALRNTPNGPVEGGFMETAKGVSGAKMIEQGKIGENETEKESSGPGAISRTDPTFMRLLSRLQLIDLLGLQVDRKPDNYFIQMDKSGKVTGITGIDNEFSMGTKTGIENRIQELPGISRYVDEELAIKILNIDLDLVRLVMTDLLSSDEINALMERFDKLKAALTDVKTKLLKPNEWDDGVAKGLLDERKNYFQEITFFKGKYGPKKPKD